MNETKEKIIDTAERLFGENGYISTSLRHIISEAKVNLAAIHYHFGTKQDLLDAVVQRKALPVNEHRLKLLSQYESEYSPGPVPLEKILEAFVLPAIMLEKSPQFIKLMGRVHSEGLMPAIAQRHFQPLIERFLSALVRALPDVSREELLWKAHFAMGAMAHALIARPTMSPGVNQVPASVVSKMLVAFISHGFRAPALLDKGIEVSQ